MKILGIIAEYNPFHNGHQYHLEKAKATTATDYTICILSSNFIQRGEPSIISKWARTKSALASGIDIVIELPTLYSMSSAEYFAFGGVKILDSLNCVDFLCFGSESGSMDELLSFSDFLSDENPLFKLHLKEALKKGYSFPKAREQAILACHSENLSQPSLKMSNNILGIEYLKALKKLGSNIKPVTIERISNQYNSPTLTGSISSATSIRKNIHEATIANTMPKSSYDILEEEFAMGRGPVFSDDFSSILLCLLRKMSLSEISKINYVTEGLGNRIKKAAENSGSFAELMENLSTKRYTQTRLQRILFSALLGINSDDLSRSTKAGGPPYAKVLGFNKKGKDILGIISKKSYIPVVTNLKKLENTCNPIINRMVEIEKTASDLYVLGYKKTDFRKAGQEFTSKIVTI